MMSEKPRPPVRPGFVVWQRRSDGARIVLGEFDRRPGATARAARRSAIEAATHGAARPSQSYAAVLRSEWRIAQGWAGRSKGRESRGRGR